MPYCDECLESDVEFYGDLALCVDCADKRAARLAKQEDDEEDRYLRMMERLFGFDFLMGGESDAWKVAIHNDDLGEE